MRAAGHARLFFALWPDDVLRAAIARRMRAFPSRAGRPVVAGNLHLTLIFVGDADAGIRDCIQSAASGLPFEPFTLSLQTCGRFPGSRVLWVAPRETPPALVRLVQGLDAVLPPCGVSARTRSFHPHVTLFRKAGPLSEPVLWSPLTWYPDGFCLVESVRAPDGPVYRVLCRYG